MILTEGVRCFGPFSEDAQAMMSRGKGCHALYRSVGWMLVSLCQALSLSMVRPLQSGHCDARPTVSFPANHAAWIKRCTTTEIAGMRRN